MDDTAIFESSYHPDKKTMRRVFGVLSHKNCLLIASVALVCFIVSLTGIRTGTITIIGFIFSAVTAQTVFFLPGPAISRWLKPQRAIFNGKLGMIHTHLSDKETEGIVSRNAPYFQYSQVVRMRHINDSWLLMISPHLMLAGPVGSFTQGTAAGFPAFIREKCPAITTTF